MSETFLERIVAATREELADRLARVPLDELRAHAASAPAPRPFAAALRPAPDGPARLIAEVKRASPSRGLLAEAFDPVAQATAYAAGGAAAISVLTEPRFFLGSLDHLSAVRASVDVPVLRKDFVLDPYQVYEARAAGADAVLLICALLDDPALAALLALARDLGMEALVEAHDADETRRAVAAGATVIGVNSRDLRTFAVDTDVVRHLRPLVPADRVFIAESGIVDAAGAARARAWGADAILVGEALMKSPDPTATTHELATAPGGATAALFAGSSQSALPLLLGRHSIQPSPAGFARRLPDAGSGWNLPHAGFGRSQSFVKICGLARPEHAALARELGADAFGLVFAPQAPSHRRLTPAQAREIVRAVRHATPAPASDAGSTAPLAVGVFVNESAANIAAIAASVGLDAAQLSGDEPPEVCAELAARARIPIIKALRLRDEADLDTLDVYALAGATLMLDAHVPGMYGGSGKIGNWELARRAAARWPVILSGGLSPTNVAAAIAAVQPRGIDVSSGVETDKAKDPAKIRAFITAAKSATGSEV